MTTLHLAPNPCNTCPYLRSTPPGIWHRDEYEKLRDYDDSDSPPIAVFRCHQQLVTNEPTVCRGWLFVHADSVAVRFGIITGQLSADDLPPVDDEHAELYDSGTEACEAGLSAIKRPSAAARDAQRRLLRRGTFQR